MFSSPELLSSSAYVPHSTGGLRDIFSEEYIDEEDFNAPPYWLFEDEILEDMRYIQDKCKEYRRVADKLLRIIDEQLIPSVEVKQTRKAIKEVLIGLYKTQKYLIACDEMCPLMIENWKMENRLREALNAVDQHKQALEEEGEEGYWAPLIRGELHAAETQRDRINTRITELKDEAGGRKLPSPSDIVKSYDNFYHLAIRLKRQIRKVKQQMELMARVEKLTLTYITLKDLDEKKDKCTICFDSFTAGVKVRSCGHCKQYFHEACFGTWLKTASNCPLCRQTPWARDIGIMTHLRNFFSDTIDYVCNYMWETVLPAWPEAAIPY